MQAPKPPNTPENLGTTADVEEDAAILRASLDGKQRVVWASGLRDTIGWGWQPQTGELWGMDQGMAEVSPEVSRHGRHILCV